MEHRSDADPCATGTPWKGAGLLSISSSAWAPNLDGGRHDEPGQHPDGRRLAAAALPATTPPNNTRRVHAVLWSGGRTDSRTEETVRSCRDGGRMRSL
jgi:hypothetical protein